MAGEEGVDDRDHTLRILQLNAGTLLEPGWEQRRHEVVAWLDHLRPDVVCLQEVWEDSVNENTAAWVAGSSATQWHLAFGGAPLSGLWPDHSLRFGSAVLSRWPIDDSAHHVLPVADGDDDPIANGVPWHLFHACTAGLDVFSTHLASAPTHGLHRREQVLAIDRIVRGARGDRDASPRMGRPRDAMAAILCGDFNAEPDSDEIRYLCSLTELGGHTTFWQDAWRVAGDGGPGHTQDWRTNPIAAGLNVHRKRIDYVFVGDGFMRRGDAGRVLSARVVLDEALTGTVASDHCGLVVDVLWPDRPTD